MAKPLLVREGAFGQIYVITDYSIEGDMVIARTKHDVTDQVEAIIKARAEATQPKRHSGERP